MGNERADEIAPWYSAELLDFITFLEFLKGQALQWENANQKTSRLDLGRQNIMDKKKYLNILRITGIRCS